MHSGSSHHSCSSVLAIQKEKVRRPAAILQEKKSNLFFFVLIQRSAHVPETQNSDNSFYTGNI